VSRVGSGAVRCQVADGRWSAPSAGCAGAPDDLLATASACGLRDVAPFWRGGFGGVVPAPPDEGHALAVL
jgi:hypothetical protein